MNRYKEAKLLYEQGKSLRKISEELNINRKLLSRKLKEDGITIILVSHDMDFCSDLTDYYLVLNELGEYDFKKAGEDNVSC